MTVLTIAAASVAYQEGPVAHGQIAGEAFIAGASLYPKASDAKWYKAQCDGTAEEAGSVATGMALATADAAGAEVSVALPGSIVSTGTGTAGIVYACGRTAGSLVPTADLASSDKVTVVAIGIGSSKLQLCRVYNAGCALA